MAQDQRYDAKAWGRLADVLKAARVEQGFQLRSQMVADLVQTGRAKPSIDRILGDLERGARDNYSPSTLAAVEVWYGLPSGETRRILSHGRRTPRSVTKANQDAVIKLTNDGWVLENVDELSPDVLADLMGELATRFKPTITTGRRR